MSPSTRPVGRPRESQAPDIWVANFSGNTITRGNARTGAANGTIATDSGPRALCYGGGRVFVTNLNGNSVTAYDTTGAQVGAYAITSPSAVCYDGQSVWVTSQSGNSVSKINAATGAITGPFTVGAAPNSICFDGTSVYAASGVSSSVTKLSSAGTLQGTYIFAISTVAGFVLTERIYGPPLPRAQSRSRLLMGQTSAASQLGRTLPEFASMGEASG